MNTTSSLVQNCDGSPNTAVLIDTIVRNGFARPRIRPVWIPSRSESGSASENRLPVVTSDAAARTTSSVTRLMVPISSSAPHRPQLLTFLATS